MKKRYRVVVAEDAAWLDFRAGQEFEFDFEGSGYNETALLQGGVLEVVSKSKSENDKEQ